MAFGTKYKQEIADTLGIIWTTEIQVDPDPGSITTLNGSGTPLWFEFYGSDDIFDQNIMGSKAVIGVNSSTSFAYSELFTSENLKYKVIIKQGSTVFWNGWIMANNYQEPYNCPPYPVQIVATDGLGLLSDFNFKDLAYTERQKVSVVIHDILDLVGITTFTEFVNVYESTMDQAVGDSPFDQMGIDPDLFKGDDCYKALSEILKSFNAGIRQDQGTFIIYRYDELKDTSMKGRTFTDGTTKSATTRTPLQYINRDAQASNFWDYNGGTLTIIPQLKKLYVNQNYGFKGSFLKNYNFPYDEFVYDIDHWDLAGWTKGSVLSYFQPVSMTNAQWLGARDLNGDREGALVTNRNFTTLADYYTQTVTGISSVDKLIIELEVSLISYDGSADTGTLYVEIISTDGTYTEYYYSATGAWDTTQRFIQESIDCTKDLNWKKFTYMVDELPYSGDLTVNIYSGFDPDGTPGNIMAAYKNVSIYFANDDGIVPEGIGYTVNNNINGQVIEKEILLGDGPGFDNDHLQYAGVLNVWDGSDVIPPSKSWETVTAGTGNNEADPLCELISSELGSHYVRPKQLLDIPIRERHDDEFFKLVGNLQDTSNTTGGNNRVFAPCHGTFDVKNRQWNLTMVELL